LVANFSRVVKASSPGSAKAALLSSLRVAPRAASSSSSRSEPHRRARRLPGEQHDIIISYSQRAALGSEFVGRPDDAVCDRASPPGKVSFPGTSAQTGFEKTQTKTSLDFHKDTKVTILSYCHTVIQRNFIYCYTVIQRNFIYCYTVIQRNFLGGYFFTV
jgi:hypothetical protein